ncbi:MAG: hypothetical protein K2Q07_07760, partial [Burkholderiaceae bacterium]|nr:hypothetical protein [Burkholderiaceae bacterium]
TLVGARRQTIVVSVLESLRVYLPTFTLASVIAEVNRWRQTGHDPVDWCPRRCLWLPDTTHRGG